MLGPFIVLYASAELSNRTCPQVQPWLYGYDAYAEVEKALKRTPFTEVESSTAVVPVSDKSQEKLVSPLKSLWQRICNLRPNLF